MINYKMSHLEDTILRIIELRQKGLDDNSLANELSLTPETIQLYESSTKKAIKKSVFSGRNLESIAEITGLSSTTLQMFASYYNIPLKRQGDKQKRAYSPKKPKDQRIAEIQKIISENNPETLEELGEMVGLNPESIYINYRKAIKELNLKLPPYRKTRIKKRRLREKNLKIKEEIKQAIEDGAESIKEIAERLGISYSTVYNHRHDIELPTRKYKSKEFRIAEIRQAVKKGVGSMEELGEKVELSPGTIEKNYRSELKSLGINLPPYEENKYKSVYVNRIKNRDRLIRRGLTLEQIAKKTNVTRERVRQYIVGTGQHKVWRQSREHYEKKTSYELRKKEVGRKIEKIVEQILAAGLQNALQDASETERFAYEKATEFLTQRKHKLPNSYSFEQLFGLFKKYKEAELSGEKLSLEELGEELGIHFVNVGNIFRKLRVKPMYGTRERHTLLDFQKQALERAVEIPVPLPNISYFLELPKHGASVYYHARGIDLSKRPKISNVIKSFGIGKSVTHTLASQIYEAQDLGFSKDETTELLDINERVYDYATIHREKIGGELMDALKKLYPDREINKPWVDFREELK